MAAIGPKHYYLYTSEGGKQYNMFRRDADMSVTGQSPVARGANPDMPRFFRGRGTWFVSSSGKRRFINIGDNGNSHYTTTTTVSIDGESWTSTGRVGEKDRGSNSD